MLLLQIDIKMKRRVSIGDKSKYLPVFLFWSKLTEFLHVACNSTAKHCPGLFCDDLLFVFEKLPVQNTQFSVVASFAHNKKKRSPLFH